ncbi:MAG: phage terminase large subunit family protein [Nitrospinota bacterium]
MDETTPDAKALARERLSHSDYRRMVQLSNPSLPGYGIDEAYQKSDQRHWTLKCPACGAWTALEKAFPKKLGEDVAIIRPRADDTFYRACPKCWAELDISAGEWVPEFPGRPIHGYRISQLFSSRVDPGEILEEYRTTRFPDRFYNLKIGIPWADTQNRLDAATVLALCGEEPMLERSRRSCTMGVDTGRQLHVVISRRVSWDDSKKPRHVVYLGVHRAFSELDDLMERFYVEGCVIDGLPETHATRAFASRHPGRVYLNFFNEHQRGSTKWDRDKGIAQENRTEALDASRAAIRDRKVVLPRRCPLVEEFATHMANDAKQLREDPETGAQAYRYVRTGPDHFSLAFTYNCVAWEKEFRVEDFLIV